MHDVISSIKRIAGAVLRLKIPQRHVRGVQEVIKDTKETGVQEVIKVSVVIKAIMDTKEIEEYRAPSDLSVILTILFGRGLLDAPDRPEKRGQWGLRVLSALRG